MVFRRGIFQWYWLSWRYDEYLISDEIKMLYETTLPAKVGMRSLNLPYSIIL
jgi:hypothetical protein